jgi:pyruvate/2-oxoglutarate dehydrogenase complex dihydrolipoamide acyltransferase (E2) component
MATDVVLESLAAEMEFATIVRWLKRAGDSVVAGDPLVEVEADKANYEVEAPFGGRLSEIIAFEGDEIRVGAVLAVIEEAL